MSKQKLNYKWDRVIGTATPKAEQRRIDANNNTLKSKLFILACDRAGTAPTRRQASKWNRGRGIALSYKGAVREKP